MDVLPNQNRGWIEVITGTMFGGKSTELTRRLERSLIAGQKTMAFSKDTRFDIDHIITHKGRSIEAVTVESLEDIRYYLESNQDVQVIGIDEIQFFEEGLVALCHSLAMRGKRVICAGLDQDYDGNPFETTLGLMAEAEYVDKMLAICTECGSPALRNHLKVKSNSRILEGNEDLYTALCRTCFSTKKK